MCVCVCVCVCVCAVYTVLQYACSTVLCDACALCSVRHAASSLVHVCNMGVNNEMVYRKQILVNFVFVCLYFSPTFSCIPVSFPAVSVVFVCMYLCMIVNN